LESPLAFNKLENKAICPGEAVTRRLGLPLLFSLVP